MFCPVFCAAHTTHTSCQGESIRPLTPKRAPARPPTLGTLLFDPAQYLPPSTPHDSTLQTQDARTGCRSTQPRQSSPRRSSTDPPHSTCSSHYWHDKANPRQGRPCTGASSLVVVTRNCRISSKTPKATDRGPSVKSQGPAHPCAAAPDPNQPGSLLDYCQSWVISVSYRLRPTGIPSSP